MEVNLILDPMAGKYCESTHLQFGMEGVEMDFAIQRVSPPDSDGRGHGGMVDTTVGGGSGSSSSSSYSPSGPASGPAGAEGSAPGNTTWSSANVRRLRAGGLVRGGGVYLAHKNAQQAVFGGGTIWKQALTKEDMAPRTPPPRGSDGRHHSHEAEEFEELEVARSVHRCLLMQLGQVPKIFLPRSSSRGTSRANTKKEANATYVAGIMTIVCYDLWGWNSWITETIIYNVWPTRYGEWGL